MRNIRIRSSNAIGWLHKTANMLDKQPASIRSKAKSVIHDMYLAETEENAWKAYDLFVAAFQDKYPEAVESLVKDRDRLYTFY